MIPYTEYLLPDPVGAYYAAGRIIEDGFVVLPYIHSDPVLALKLEEPGCATVMPLGSAIGSGQGVQTLDETNLIVRQASVPAVVDAGLGVPSEAALALETGADAVLVNSAIAQAADPAAMGEAFKLGVEAGPKAYLAGRIDRREAGVPSSPAEGVASVAGV